MLLISIAYYMLITYYDWQPIISVSQMIIFPVEANIGTSWIPNGTSWIQEFFRKWDFLDTDSFKVGQIGY